MWTGMVIGGILWVIVALLKSFVLGVLSAVVEVFAFVQALVKPPGGQRKTRRPRR